MKVHLSYNALQQSMDVFRNEFEPEQMVRISDRERWDDETVDLLDRLRECDEIEGMPYTGMRVFNCELSNWIFTELAAKHGLTR